MLVARGSASLLLNHGRGIWPRDVLKKVSRGVSQVEAGNPGFPRPVQVTSWGFSWWLLEVREVEVGGVSRDSTGLVHWKRASSPVEAGTSGFLSISDSDHRVLAELGQESQASSWVEAWNSACLSRCSRGERPFVELYLEPGGFSGRCTRDSLPLRVDFIHRVEFQEVSGHWVLIKRGPGNRGSSECGTTHEATSGISS